MSHGCQRAIARFLESYVFGPSGFWTMAPLRYDAKFDPFPSLDCAHRPPPWRNPRRGRDQLLPSGNLEEEGTGNEIVAVLFYSLLASTGGEALKGGAWYNLNCSTDLSLASSLYPSLPYNRLLYKLLCRQWIKVH